MHMSQVGWFILPKNESYDSMILRKKQLKLTYFFKEKNLNIKFLGKRDSLKKSCKVLFLLCFVRQNDALAGEKEVDR